MKRFFPGGKNATSASRDNVDKNENKGGKKNETPAKSSASKPKGEKPPQRDGQQKKTAPPGNVPKSVRNAQSALRPGNTSGLVKQKGHPEVQFGPLLKEFLLSKEMVNKGIKVVFDQSEDRYAITVSFKRVLDNGVSTSSQTDLKIEDYLAQRKGLLKVKDEVSHFQGFVTRLLDRLGVDVTKAKPCVSFRSVENFILKHLSPVERGVLQLSDEEYDRVDTMKIPQMMEPTKKVITETYGSFENRSTFLVKIINTEESVRDIPPPNWALKGVAGISKGVLLETLKIQHVPRITEEQRQIINSLATSLFGSDQSTVAASQKTEGHDEGEEENVL